MNFKEKVLNFYENPDESGKRLEHTKVELLVCSGRQCEHTTNEQNLVFRIYDEIRFGINRGET